MSNTNPNSYAINAAETIEAYATFLQATPDDVIVALSFSPLTEAARFALERSATALGFGEGRIAYGTIVGATGSTLEPNDLWLIIEGIDPLGVVIADEGARGLFEVAYRCTLSDEESTTVAGRHVVSFADTEALLANPEGKQRLWHGLKALPYR